ncbi:hypothetical protein CEP53_014388, partial [Fusarium sp. AF-6]
GRSITSPKSWQWLFLIYGIISVFFGLFVIWYMPDSPMRAKFFSEADKTLMVERVFLSWNAPRYFIAFATHMGCYTLLVLVLIFFRWYLIRENRKRDELAAAGVPEAADDQLVHAFEDMTDRENPNFRYVY